jgi:SEC-C motif-containing protein
MMMIKSLPPVTAAALTIQFPAPAARFPAPAARFPEPAARFPAPAARFPARAAQSASTSNMAQFPSVSNKGKLRL